MWRTAAGLLRPTSSARSWLGPVPLGLSIAVACLVILRVTLRLPEDPVTTSDSAEYLAMAAHRPPLYGLFLMAMERLAGGFDRLPLAQGLLLSAAALACAVELSRLLRVPAAAMLLVPMVLLHPVVHDAIAWMMTEALFLACMLLGMALQIRFARTGRGGCLVAAALIFALASITRSTGMALLPLPLLAALFDRRRSGWRSLRLAGAAALAASLVLVAAMGGNWARHQRFEIGSFTGIALLGKALLLLEPEDLPSLPAAAASSLDDAIRARALIARQPDFAARLRAQLQATEDLRYASFFPAAERSWPEWAAADWRRRSELGQAMASRLIARHPAGYVRLWLNDVVSLLVYPNFWPAALSASTANPSDFPACGQQGNCWALTRYDVPLLVVCVLVAISVGAAAGGASLLLRQSWPVLRRRASPETVLLCGVAVALVITLLSSAAAEAGFTRYAAPVYVLAAVLVIVLADRACSTWRTS